MVTMLGYPMRFPTLVVVPRGQRGAVVTDFPIVEFLSEAAVARPRLEDVLVAMLRFDALAARTARARGIDTRWTTSLVLEAAAGSVLSKQEARGVIEELVRSGLRIAPAVLLELLRALS